MGKHDSTTTRVTPVFDALEALDPTGEQWLGRLLGLPTGGSSTDRPNAPGPIRRAAWGENEIALAAPRSLLHRLVEHLPANPPPNLGTTSAQTRERRQRLVDGDTAAVKDAHDVLDLEPLPASGWCVFEGETQPDVYIETDSMIVVIEGKRTEPGPTRATRWMNGRDQMIRHLDCAWERRNGKRVIGFYIVEGAQDGDAAALEPSAEWSAAAAETISAEVLRTSLPHRSAAACEEIAAAYLGVTTWQRVAEEFGLSWAAITEAMLATPFRFALVELFSPQRSADGLGEGITKALLADPSRRERQVRVVLESLPLEDADLIVLPGWTLVGPKPPSWIVERSQGCTIVLEMMSTSASGKDRKSLRTYVVQNGRVVVGPESQELAVSEQAWSASGFTPKAHELAKRMSGPRKWTLGRGGRAALAICGEINIAHGNNDIEVPDELQLDDVAVVVNPSHTRMGLPALLNKRAHLSKTGLLLATANTHDAGPAADKASVVAADVYWKGVRVEVGHQDVFRSEDGFVRAQRIWLDDATNRGTAVVLGDLGKA